MGADGASPSKFFEWRCRAAFAWGAPFVPNGRVGSPQRTQDSGAQRRLCWMQRRLPPQTWAPTTETLGGVEEAHRRWPEGRSERGASKAKHRPPSFSMGAAAPLSHGAPPFVPNGRVGSPQRTQTSGAQRRLRGACESQTRAAPAYALRVSVLASRRKYGTPAARRPYQTFSKSAALLWVIGKFGIATRANNPDFTLARQPWQ
jgi:hypothetical protein